MFQNEALEARDVLANEEETSKPFLFWLKDEPSGQAFQVSMDTWTAVAKENIIREEKGLPPLWRMEKTIKEGSSRVEPGLRLGKPVDDEVLLLVELNQRDFIMLTLPRLKNRSNFVGTPSAVIMNTRHIGLVPLYDYVALDVDRPEVEDGE